MFLFVNSNEKEPKGATKVARCLKLGIKNSFRDEYLILMLWWKTIFNTEFCTTSPLWTPLSIGNVYR